MLNYNSFFNSLSKIDIRAYINTLSDTDVSKQHNIYNIYNLKCLYYANISLPNKFQQKIISEVFVVAQQKINKFIETKPQNDIDILFMEMLRKNRTKITFMLHKLPSHTMNNIIYLNGDVFQNDNFNHNLLDTIIHEYIHIQQRNNRQITDIIANFYGIKRTRSIYQRGNPDINEYDYSNIHCIYNKFNPKITDVSDNGDHPFEIMAYDLTSKIILL